MPRSEQSMKTLAASRSGMSATAGEVFALAPMRLRFIYPSSSRSEVLVKKKRNLALICTIIVGKVSVETPLASPRRTSLQKRWRADWPSLDIGRADAILQRRASGGTPSRVWRQPWLLNLLPAAPTGAVFWHCLLLRRNTAQGRFAVFS